MKALYIRHGFTLAEHFKTFVQAYNFLKSGEDKGNFSALGTYDKKTNTFYCYNEPDLLKRAPEDIKKEALAILEKQNIYPTNFEFIN
jgi:hypothetical protein